MTIMAARLLAGKRAAYVPPPLIYSSRKHAGHVQVCWASNSRSTLKHFLCIGHTPTSDPRS